MRKKRVKIYTSAYLESYFFIHAVIKFFHMYFGDLEIGRQRREVD